MEIERKLFNEYKKGELAFIPHGEFFEACLYRTLKLVEENNKKEMKKHSDLFIDFEEESDNEFDKGFFFALAQLLLLRIEPDKKEFIKSFKKTLKSINLEEYIDDFERIV